MSDQFIGSPALSNMETVVFTAPRKKFATAGLIFVGLALVILLIGIFLALWLDGNGGVFFLVALVFVVIFGVIGVMTATTALEPPRLQIDASGLTMSARGHRHRILWSQIEEIRIISLFSLMGRTATGRSVLKRVPPDRRPAHLDQFWLVAWLYPGVPLPKGHIYLPEWREEIGGVRICDLSYMYTSPAEIGNAVARFAGKRWNESREPR